MSDGRMPTGAESMYVGGQAGLKPPPREPSDDLSTHPDVPASGRMQQEQARRPHGRPENIENRARRPVLWVPPTAPLGRRTTRQNEAITSKGQRITNHLRVRSRLASMLGVGRLGPRREPAFVGRPAALLTRIEGESRIGSMSSAEVDTYLADVEEPKRSTLQRLRQMILEVVPEAEEGISYGVPAFRLQGKVVAGFAAFKNHLSYLPHSGSVFPALQDELAPYKTSPGALQFPIDSPLPKPLVEHLVSVRIAQAFPDL